MKNTNIHKTKSNVQVAFYAIWPGNVSMQLPGPVWNSDRYACRPRNHVKLLQVS